MNDSEKQFHALLCERLGGPVVDILNYGSGRLGSKAESVKLTKFESVPDLIFLHCFVCIENEFVKG